MTTFFSTRLKLFALFPSLFTEIRIIGLVFPKTRLGCPEQRTSALSLTEDVLSSDTVRIKRVLALLVHIVFHNITSWQKLAWRPDDSANRMLVNILIRKLFSFFSCVAVDTFDLSVRRYKLGYGRCGLRLFSRGQPDFPRAAQRKRPDLRASRLPQSHSRPNSIPSPGYTPVEKLEIDSLVFGPFAGPTSMSPR